VYPVEVCGTSVARRVQERRGIAGILAACVAWSHAARDGGARLLPRRRRARRRLPERRR